LDTENIYIVFIELLFSMQRPTPDRQVHYPAQQKAQDKPQKVVDKKWAWHQASRQSAGTGQHDGIIKDGFFVVRL
jgi:hypothetical protein